MRQLSLKSRWINCIHSKDAFNKVSLKKEVNVQQLLIAIRKPESYTLKIGDNRVMKLISADMSLVSTTVCWLAWGSQTYVACTPNFCVQIKISFVLMFCRHYSAWWARQCKKTWLHSKHKPWFYRTRRVDQDDVSLFLTTKQVLR